MAAPERRFEDFPAGSQAPPAETHGIDPAPRIIAAPEPPSHPAPPPRPARCCARLLEVIERDDVLCVLTNLPFTSVSMPPALFLQSDGGHGGLEPISHCPFCGAEVRFDANS